MSDDDPPHPRPPAYRVKDFIGTSEAARLIGVTTQTIHKWARDRRLVPIIAPSGYKRYRRSTVIAFADKYKRETGSITDGALHKAVFTMFRDAEMRGVQTQMIHRDVVIELSVPIAIVRELWAEYSTALGAPVLVPKAVTVAPPIEKTAAKKLAKRKAEEDHERELAELDERHAAREAEEEAAHQAHLALLRGKR